jgi:cytochrome c oxidase cbb3-type subunit 3
VKCLAIALLVALPVCVPVAGQDVNYAALEGAKQPPEAVERGAVTFSKNCASCHGPAAKGLNGQTDLIRSALVRDDEKGEEIGPALRAGHPLQGPRLNDVQIADIVAWLHVQVYKAANRGTYEFLNILTGDPKKGERFFQGAGKCNSCHSITGDLSGIGEKYDPPVLQSLWLSPLRRRGAAASRTARTVTVAPPSGPAISGILIHLDEFSVTLRDSSGADRSFSIDNDVPRVEIHDPLQPHFDLYPRLTDDDVHNITAYLATIK